MRRIRFATLELLKVRDVDRRVKFLLQEL